MLPWVSSYVQSRSPSPLPFPALLPSPPNGLDSVLWELNLGVWLCDCWDITSNFFLVRLAGVCYPGRLTCPGTKSSMKLQHEFCFFTLWEVWTWFTDMLLSRVEVGGGGKKVHGKYFSENKLVMDSQRFCTKINTFHGSFHEVFQVALFTPAGNNTL